MKPRIQEVCVECTDPRQMAEFWGQVLQCPWGYQPEPGGVVDAGDMFIFFELFEAATPQGPVTANRLHLDVEVDDLAAAVTRAERLGASFTGESFNDPSGGGFVTMRDPEGNAFCFVCQPGDTWSKLLKDMAATTLTNQT